MLVNAYGQAVLERGRRIADEFAAIAKSLHASGLGRLPNGQLLLAAVPNGRRLAIVTSLAEQKNMCAVARELSVTQAAISAGLKKLEDRLGAPLFTRSAKGLVPTDTGELVLLHFHRVLAELRNIRPDLAAMTGLVHGTVTMGALPLGRTRIVPSAIASVLARYPRLRVVTNESPYGVLTTELRSGDIDFVFGALRPAGDAKDLCQEPLFDDHLSIIARAGHPLATHRSVSLRDLRGVRWVMLRAEAPARQWLQRWCHHASEPLPQPSVETGDLAILRGLLLHSDMVTAISAEQLHREIASGSMVVLPIRLSGTRHSIGFVHRQRALPSPGTRVLMDEIRECVHNMIASGELLPVDSDRDFIA
jgi:LysR family transcriptional regulator of gallate degradation